MLGHSQSGEEMTGTPLDKQALLCISIIRDPELVEVGQGTPVHTSATT